MKEYVTHFETWMGVSMIFEVAQGDDMDSRSRRMGSSDDEILYDMHE